MIQDSDIKVRFILLELDDACVLTVRKEGEDTVLFCKDEREGLGIGLIFRPEHAVQLRQLLALLEEQAS